MAFVSHALPAHPRRRKFAHSAPRASLPPGRLSVSRRRRLYDFQQQVNPASPSSLKPATAKSKPALNTSLPSEPSSVTGPAPNRTAAPLRDRAAVIAEISALLAKRDADAAADSTSKRADWEATMAALRGSSKSTSSRSSSSVDADTKLSGSSSQPSKAVDAPPAVGKPDEKIRDDVKAVPDSDVSGSAGEEAVGNAAVSAKPEDSPSLKDTESSASESSSDRGSDTSAPSEKVESAATRVRDGLETLMSAAASVADLYGPPASASGDAEQSSSKKSEDNEDSNVFQSMADAAGAAVQSAADMLESITESNDKDGGEDDGMANIATNMVEDFRKKMPDFENGISEAAAEALLGNSEELPIRTDIFPGDVNAKVVPEEDYTDEDAEDSEDANVDADGGNIENVGEAKSAAAPATEEQKKSLGEKLLDAIVDGVPVLGTDEEQARSDLAEKAELAEMVKSGKLKNLTVTKLRRLLSSNGLKTSGRKAELIARLTSFANTK